MPANRDVEVIAAEIDRLSIATGSALAESYVHNFSSEFDELPLKVVDYIFVNAAVFVLERFPDLNDAERITLRNRAIPTLRAAFENRLSELCQDPI